MTLVLGLRGKDHVVVAADRLGHINKGTGDYGYKCAKLRPMTAGKRQWIVGMAGSDMAITLADRVAATGDTLPGKHAGVELAQVYAEELRVAAQASGCDEPMWFLFAGVDSRGSFIYHLSFDGQNWRGPGEHTGDQLAIGASCHGALYFASEHHSPEMSQAQRLLLAHFCIAEAAKHDIRIERPVDMAIAGDGDALFVTESDVPAIPDRSKAIAGAIGELLRVPYAEGGSSVDDLVVDKDKFDAVLRALINSKPLPFSEAVARPKPRKDGGFKRSAKKTGR